MTSKKKCESDGISYLSYPPQSKCKNCGKFWSGDTPFCEDITSQNDTCKKCGNSLDDKIEVFACGRCLNPINNSVSSHNDIWREILRKNVDYDNAELGCNWSIDDLENFISQEIERARNEGIEEGLKLAECRAGIYFGGHDGEEKPSYILTINKDDYDTWESLRKLSCDKCKTLYFK